MIKLTIDRGTLYLRADSIQAVTTDLSGRTLVITDKDSGHVKETPDQVNDKLRQYWNSQRILNALKDS